MSYKTTAANAAQWALSKLGCPYSQAKRTQKNFFDCSSLVARAYDAQGKQWKYGGSVPLSNQEVYDDDFELLWPVNYEEIGKRFGGTDVIQLGKQPGDLQFLCTDSKTGRANRITHVTMVADSGRIVHARGKAYGVCTNALTHYSGKVCAILRYNPSCTLCQGMKGYRTLALQQALNALGARLEEDGEYGTGTASAVKVYQASMGLSATGSADAATLKRLKLLTEDSGEQNVQQDAVRITGNTVNLRSGPGTNFSIARVARRDEVYPAIRTTGWQPILLDGEVRWISEQYCVRENQDA